MKKMMTLGLVLALVVPAIAGDYKCQEDADTCLTNMAQHLKKKGWVGIEMDEDTDSGLMRIVRVVSESPAEAAGFEVGDLMMAFNNIRFAEDNKAALKEAYGALVPGNSVIYTVKREGVELEVKVHLGKIPETVMAQWVGQHMLEHHVGSGEEQLAEAP